MQAAKAPFMSALRQIVDMLGGLFLLAMSFAVGLAVAFGTVKALLVCGASHHTAGTFGGLLLIQVPIILGCFGVLYWPYLSGHFSPKRTGDDQETSPTTANAILVCVALILGIVIVCSEVRGELNPVRLFCELALTGGWLWGLKVFTRRAQRLEWTKR